MGLSGTATGGANTNLTGLSPEQIAQISQTNVAGGKLAQDSIQNIFENVQKMAYSDYLDRLPQDKQFKETADSWYSEDGGDGFVHLVNKITGETKRTNIPVPKKKLDYGPLAGGGNTIIIGTDPNGNPVPYSVPKKGEPVATQIKTKEGTPVISAEQARKQEQTERTLSAKDAEELAKTDQILSGTYKDPKTKKTIEPTNEHTERYNALSSRPEAAFIKKVPGNILGSWSPNKEVVRKPIPGGIPTNQAYKMFQFFRAEGGSGTYEQFISNPGIMAQVAEAMRNKK